MFRTTGVRSAVAIAVLASLSACGSGSDDPVVQDIAETPNDQPTTPGMPDENLENPEPSQIDPLPPVVTPDPVARFGPAQIITSECGSAPSAATVATNSVTSPPEFFVGEPVNGQLAPDSTTDNFHVWQIALEPGNYHFVADTWDGEAEKTAIGIEIESLGETTADNERIAADTEFTYDLRVYEYLEIQSAQVLTLKVDAAYDEIHNYTMGIFQNGTAVPSPGFNRCLPINALSLDSTQTATVGGDNDRENSAWYQINLSSGEYTINASTSSVEDDAIGYEITVFDEFGQGSDGERVSTDSEFGNLLTTSDTFVLDTDGSVWIQLRNAYSAEDDALVVEFTVTKN